MEEIPLYFATEPGGELLSLAVVHPASTHNRSPLALKQIENYLFGLEGVSNASVWEREGQLSAYVCVESYTNWNSGSIKKACQIGIGKENAPDIIHVAIEGSPDYASMRLAA